MFMGGQFEKQEVNLNNGVLQRLIMFGNLSNQIVIFMLPPAPVTIVGVGGIMFYSCPSVCQSAFLSIRHSVPSKKVLYNQLLPQF